MQVFEQAVRLAAGERPPRAHRHGTWLTYVKGMAAIAPSYVSGPAAAILGAHVGPHKADPSVWGRRPLEDATVAYSAHDVHLIGLLLREFRARHVPDELLRAAKAHSQRYAGAFRDRANAIEWPDDKSFVLEELPIVTLDEWCDALGRSPEEESCSSSESRDDEMQLMRECCGGGDDSYDNDDDDDGGDDSSGYWSNLN